MEEIKRFSLEAQNEVKFWKDKYESLSLRHVGLFNMNKALRACSHEMKNCCNCCHSDIDIENIEKPVVPFLCEKWGEQFKDVLPCEYWDMRESKLGGYEKNKSVFTGSVVNVSRIDCK